MKNKIIFDLDDTIINTRNRHYNVVKLFYQSKFSKEFINYESYEAFRLSGASNYQILSSICNTDYIEFKDFWHSNIESLEMLDLDQKIIDLELLKKIKKKFNFNFIVVSLRSNIENAIKQVKKFDFYNEFEEFIFLKHSKVNPKVNILKEINLDLGVLYFIGDSYTDFEAARLNNIKFKHVQTGWEKKHKYSESYKNINTIIKNIFYE